MPHSCSDNGAPIGGASSAEGQTPIIAGAAAALSQVHPQGPPSH